MPWASWLLSSVPIFLKKILLFSSSRRVKSEEQIAKFWPIATYFILFLFSTDIYYGEPFITNACVEMVRHLKNDKMSAPQQTYLLLNNNATPVETESYPDMGSFFVGKLYRALKAVGIGRVRKEY